jgi:ABC-type phosphate/phosphonate transport system substrate-binding protein
VKKVLTLLGLLVVCGIQPAMAALVFSAPPRESAADGEKIYAPLAKFFSEILGEKVEYEHPQNWIQYARNMRDGRYDIVFDGPHFSAWRMNNVGHTPVVRLKGALGFVLIAHKNNRTINTLDDLVGKKICGLASPNLGTVSVFALFKNPVKQPQMVNITGGMRNVLETFLNTKQCDAAVIRDKLYGSLPQERKDSIKIIAKSKSMPNQTVTMNSKILKGNKDIIVEALLSPSGGSAAAQNIFKRFSKKQNSFMKADDVEYTELELLLEGVVFGW